MLIKLNIFIITVAWWLAGCFALAGFSATNESFIGIRLLLRISSCCCWLLLLDGETTIFIFLLFELELLPILRLLHLELNLILMISRIRSRLILPLIKVEHLTLIKLFEFRFEFKLIGHFPIKVGVLELMLVKP